MWLQLIVILFAFILLQNYKRNGDNAESRHKYVVWLMVILILQSAMRHLAVGADTFSYYRSFEQIKETSWDQIIQEFYNVYVLGQGKDAGYGFIQKIFQVIFPYFRVFLFAVAICFFVPLGKLLEKSRISLPGLFLSLCIYEAIYYDFFSVTGIRQTIATIATILGVKYIVERKLLKFSIAIILAAFIHKSVLIFYPLYFIAFYPKSKHTLLLSICLLPVIFPLARSLAFIMATYSDSEQYMYYALSEYDNSGAKNFMLFMLVSAILVLYAKIKKIDGLQDYMVHSIALGLFFVPLVWVDPTLMRVVQYFSIFIIIAVPVVLDNIKGNKFIKSLIYGVYVIVMIFTIIKHNAQYAFFWQAMQLGQNYM